MARGFTQIYGVDYYETYSLVARLASFHLLMAIAARNRWAIDAFNFDQPSLTVNWGMKKLFTLSNRLDMKQMITMIGCTGC